ncbi:MAG: hypothetical protein JF584_06405 [Acidobacteria bacterium]|nr:hypothetical protein [Acidobacteriota bacterium]
MKTTRVYLAILLAIMVVTPVVMAVAAQQQEEQVINKQVPGPEPPADRMLALYTRKLNLTPDQQAQMKPLLEERQQKLTALRNDSSVRGRQRLHQVKQIRDDEDKKINTVLNDDQKKEYAQLEEQQIERMRQHRRGQRALDEVQ